jgi:hypothetical protein
MKRFPVNVGEVKGGEVIEFGKGFQDFIVNRSAHRHAPPFNNAPSQGEVWLLIADLVKDCVCFDVVFRVLVSSGEFHILVI